MSVKFNQPGPVKLLISFGKHFCTDDNSGVNEPVLLSAGGKAGAMFNLCLTC